MPGRPPLTNCEEIDKTGLWNTVWQYVPFHKLILIRCCVDMLCCLTVIMDMSAAGTGTAGLLSGSIPPPSQEAAARVKTTSTAQGENLHLCTLQRCGFVHFVMAHILLFGINIALTELKVFLIFCRPPFTFMRRGTIQYSKVQYKTITIYSLQNRINTSMTQCQQNLIIISYTEVDLIVGFLYPIAVNVKCKVNCKVICGYIWSLYFTQIYKSNPKGHQQIWLKCHILSSSHVLSLFTDVEMFLIKGDITHDPYYLAASVNAY